MRCMLCCACRGCVLALRDVDKMSFADVVKVRCCRACCAVHAVLCSVRHACGCARRYSCWLRNCCRGGMHLRVTFAAVCRAALQAIPASTSQLRAHALFADHQ